MTTKKKPSRNSARGSAGAISSSAVHSDAPAPISYDAFLKAKAWRTEECGLEPVDLPDALFPFQRHIVEQACRRGRAAIFADCGLGKTLMQLAWAQQVAHKGSVLVLAPLAVAQQTIAEGARFGIEARYLQKPDGDGGIIVTNYERLEAFLPWTGAGVVLDESSILKAYDGKTRTMIIEAFARTPYRLACTATPAPNDFMELGNHAQFLGVMTREEMLAMFFTHDGGDTSKWRIKGHAEDVFWKWVCGWSVALRKPSDIGFDDACFELPPLTWHEHVMKVDQSQTFARGMLFPMAAQTLTERRDARRSSIDARIAHVAALVAEKPDEPWLLWCGLNDESERLTAAIPGAVEVTGSDSAELKAERLTAFAQGTVRVLVSKSSIAGFGMNFQRCANVAFVGLSDSFEQLYQSVRRCWRYGQTREVHAHLVIGEAEGAVLQNVKRKEADAETLATEMVKHMSDSIEQTTRQSAEYRKAGSSAQGWDLRLGDCVERVAEMDADSIDYTIFSPPFASLYTYSNSDRDMGNCKDAEEFAKHFGFLVPELLRVTKPGRLLSFHCMNLPTSKVRDGVIGLTDFRGNLIRMFREAGWIFHSEVVIWKDPVTAMQRTKALGLLYKQLRKDSAMSRQGIPDYLVTMRKPGVNPEPVTKTHESFPVDLWQNYASPVWMDINPNKTLQSIREDEDERHICPLQLEVIERAIRLWTNPGDLVLSPFAGIGSEGHVAVQEDRRFIGVELKPAYFDQATKNLTRAVMTKGKQMTLFDNVALLPVGDAEDRIDQALAATEEAQAETTKLEAAKKKNAPKRTKKKSA